MISQSDNRATKGLVAARQLLERKSDPTYLAEWKELLSASKKEEGVKKISIVVFRLGNEWLAIPSQTMREVISYRKPHRIPHRSNEIVQGLVNYGGKLSLSVNMHAFLGINEVHPKDQSPSYSRMMTIEKDRNIWIFSVDDILGIANIDSSQIRNVPVTLAKSQSNYLKGIATLKALDVGLIDDELLFFGLKKGL